MRFPLLAIILVVVTCFCGNRNVALADAPPEPPDRSRTAQPSASSSQTPSASAPVGERADVQGTIKLCIAALEAEKPDYAAFIAEFADPQSVIRLKEKKDKFEKAAAEFGKSKATSLLKILKSVSGKEPSKVDGDTVTFDFNPVGIEGIGGKSKVSFRKVDGKYYLMN
ncbi:MAG: hypothetical protein ACAI35_25545 [Candidatus Methylacidiphilales bacterium]